MRIPVPNLTGDDEIQRFTKALTDKPDKDLISQLTKNLYSNATLTAMNSDWRNFNDFCKLKDLCALPASENTFIRFIEFTKETKKYNTIKRHITNVGVIHSIVLNKNPTNTTLIKHNLGMLSHSDAHKVEEYEPLTQDHLDTLHLKLSKDPSSINVRDNLIAHLMFDAALKRKELINITVDDINKRYKTVQIQDGNYPVRDATWSLMLKWMKLIGEGEALFRRIDRHGNIGTEKMDDSSVYRALKKLSNMLNLPNHRRLSTHSVRIGAIKNLHDDGVSVSEIQHFGRYASPAMPTQYAKGKDTADPIFKQHQKQ